MQKMQPKDKFASICLLGLITCGLLYGELLFSPACIKLLVLPLGALAFGLLLLSPFPLIKKWLSIELRIRTITNFLLVTTAAELFAFIGEKSLGPFSMAIVLSVVIILSYWFSFMLEPVMYRFLEGESDDLSK